MDERCDSILGWTVGTDGFSCLKRRVNPSKKVRRSFHIDGGGFGVGAYLFLRSLVVVRALVRFIYIT